MIKSITISWFAFVVGVLILILVHLISSRTRIGKHFINKRSPWNVREWNVILILIGITLFILVNPVFNLLTIGIFAILYYIFINRNFYNKNLNRLRKKKSSGLSDLDLGAQVYETAILQCKAIDFSNQLEERKALDKCLFSFPEVHNQYKPHIDYMNNTYHIKLNLRSNESLASLSSYLERSGFEVNRKIEQ